MEAPGTITLARPEDIAALADIELAAATLLQGHAPRSVLDETTPAEHFHQAQRDGRLWVALVNDIPVGFGHVEMLAADLPHLEELDVHPRHGRRGIGTGLVRTICDWGAREGYRELTLTTFRSVAWNMPFYAKLGFEVVPPSELRPEIEAVMQDEAGRGLDRARRVAMRRRLRGGPDAGDGRGATTRNLAPEP